MVIGGYEIRSPPEGKFQIVSWRSPDQLNWTYEGPVLTTRQLPPEGGRAVYSPTMTEVVPGLYRMLFTADDLNAPGGRSRLWSAVSTDKEHWRLEGEFLADPVQDYYYSTFAGGRLVTVLGSDGFARKLYTAKVEMP